MIMRRMVAFLLSLCLVLSLAAPALADAELLPQWQVWDLEALPMEATLSVALETHMPFDEDRLAQLNAMLSHVTMRLHDQALAGERWQTMTLMVDGEEALTAATREASGETQVQLSYLPGETFLLPEGENLDVSLYGLDGTELALLEDLLTIFENAEIGLTDYMSEKTVSEKVKNMGTAKRKQTFTVPKDAVDGLGSLLSGLCPEGEVQRFVSGLTFSGKQTLTLYKNNLGDIIRVEYKGDAGLSEDDLREVSLSWRLRRDDSQVRDELTLKTPKSKGSGRNNIVLERTLIQEESSAKLDAEFKYEQVSGGEKTVLSGEIALKSESRESETTLTGDVDVKLQLPGEEEADRTVLTPSLTLRADGAPSAQGVVRLEEYKGKRLQERADITLTLTAAELIDWALRERFVTLDDSARQRILSGAATALVRRLVLLPEEDALFLSADLDPLVWQQIVDAARTALQEEVIP